MMVNQAEAAETTMVLLFPSRLAIFAIVDGRWLR
jgi:hypothetical protein